MVRVTNYNYITYLLLSSYDIFIFFYTKSLTLLKKSTLPTTTMLKRFSVKA